MRFVSEVVILRREPPECCHAKLKKARDRFCGRFKEGASFCAVAFWVDWGSTKPWSLALRIDSSKEEKTGFSG